jgi:hypothetical protein
VVGLAEADRHNRAMGEDQAREYELLKATRDGLPVRGARGQHARRRRVECRTISSVYLGRTNRSASPQANRRRRSQRVAPASVRRASTATERSHLQASRIVDPDRCCSGTQATTPTATATTAAQYRPRSSARRQSPASRNCRDATRRPGSSPQPALSRVGRVSGGGAQATQPSAAE